MFNFNEKITLAVVALDEQFSGYVQKVLDGTIEIMDDYDGAYFALYQLFEAEMPYGTAKARDGDPDEFIFNRLDELFPSGVVQTGV